MALENQSKTVAFCLRLGVINHVVALAVFVLGCAYSGFTCQGEGMKDVLSLYAFTAFFPQLALEAILLMALLLASNSFRDFQENKKLSIAFILTFAALMGFALSQQFAWLGLLIQAQLQNVQAWVFTIKINNFTTIESDYGKFIVNRYCAFQAESLIKTGKPHIQSELNNILSVVNTLPENSVTIDVGANIGLVAVPIAQLVLPKNGKVYAFEAQRMMAYALCGSAALNDLENLIIFNTALGASSGTLKASKPDYGVAQDFGLFSLVDQETELADKVDVLTIDSLDLPRLEFLKIDVEGMEIEVLQGCQDSIRAHQTWCWIEYWKVDIEEIKSQFSGLEYSFYIMDELNMLCAPAARLAENSFTINAKQVQRCHKKQGYQLGVFDRTIRLLSLLWRAN